MICGGSQAPGLDFRDLRCFGASTSVQRTYSHEQHGQRVAKEAGCSLPLTSELTEVCHQVLRQLKLKGPLNPLHISMKYKVGARLKECQEQSLCVQAGGEKQPYFLCSSAILWNEPAPELRCWLRLCITIRQTCNSRSSVALLSFSGSLLLPPLRRNYL